MDVNRIRIGLVGSVVLALTGANVGGAVAATNGRGTASSSITLLDVKLGELQSIKVLTDEGQGTLDPSRFNLAGPEAFGSFSALNASGIINLALPNPAIKATAPGAAAGSLNSMAIQFPPAGVTGVANVPVPLGSLVKGTINPAKVEANQDADGARSFVATDVPSLDVLSGLVSIKDVKVAGVANNAAPGSSTADSGLLSIGEIGVLDLSSFLGGLGLGLADLPIGTLTDLVGSLGLPLPTAGIPGLSSGAGLGDIKSILNSVTGLSGLIGSVTGASSCGVLSGLLPQVDALGLGGLLAPATGILSPLTGLLGNLTSITNILSSCSDVDAAKASVLSPLTSTLDGLLPTASGLLDGIFGVLDGAPLLSISGVELSALAKAADTLDASQAVASTKFGTLKVGGKEIGALNIGATVEQVNALVNQAEGVLNTVTSLIGMPNLIDIGLFEKTSSKKVESGYNVAEAQVSAVRVSINPPAALSNILSTVTGSGVGSLLGGLGNIGGLTNGLALPVDTGLADGLLAGAFNVTSILSQPTTIRVANIRAMGDYTQVAGATLSPTQNTPQAPAGGTLPRTGMNGGLVAALAALAVAGAFGISKILGRKPVEG